MVATVMNPKISYRRPMLEDGWSIFELIKACPPLDVNSAYCYLLQCEHHAETSVVAELNGEVVGFISGYLIPQRPDTLFIWQVAVGDKARGRGTGTRMLQEIAERDSCASASYIETTITDDNAASWALFSKVADVYAAPLQRAPLFEQSRHFAGQHDTEYLVRFGPLQRPHRAAVSLTH